MSRLQKVTPIFSWILIHVFIWPAFAEPLSKRNIAAIHVKRWELVEMRSQTGKVKSPNELCGRKNFKLYLDFKTNGELNGSMCCNSFSGKYTIRPGSNDIIINELSMTLLGCAPEPKLDDPVFLSIIKGIYKIEMVDSDLNLFSSVGDGVLIYKALTSQASPITNNESEQQRAK